MTNKDKLRRALDGLSNRDSGLEDAFKSVQEELTRVAQKIREEAQAKTIDDVKKMTGSFKGQIQDGLDSLTEALANLKEELSASEQDLASELKTKVEALNQSLDGLTKSSTQDMDRLAKEIETLKPAIAEIAGRKVKFPDFGKQIDTLESKLVDMVTTLQENDDKDDEARNKKFQKDIDGLSEEIFKLRKETITAIGRSHGGQANRNIMVGGNSSTLSRYGDINIKAGANVTLTYLNNDNLKTTDITIASSGGGGSVIGTTRSINNISTSQAAGATSGTDYVYICTAGVKLTLPTAALNTNLYTVKNTSTSSVLVATTGGETIDAQTNAILNTQYTSIDLISDSTNWEIT